MPTILRFRNFRIVIFTEDHGPPHIHAVGPGIDSSYFLECPHGPVHLRSNAGTTRAEQKALIGFLTQNLDKLCPAWEEYDARRKHFR